MVTCLARSSCNGGGSDSGRADGSGGELLAALTEVLRCLPGGAVRLKAACAVVDAGAVPALVHAIRHAGASGTASTIATTTTTTASMGRSDPSSGAWDAVAVLEQLLVIGPKSDSGVAARAATQALASGAVDALLPLLCAPAPQSQESWRVLRILLVLERFAAPRLDTGGAATVANDPPAETGATDSGGGCGLGAAAATNERRAGAGRAGVVLSLSAAPPAVLDGLLRAARDLLSTPHSLTDSTAESLLLLFAELLSPTAAAVTIAGADCSVAVPALVSAEQLRKAAPGLVAAAVGILMGGRPDHDWAALLTCARERNPQSGSGTIRFPVQLEAAAAALLDELLVWAAAVREGEDGGWRSWLPVAALAGALVQRWLDRPGVFEALGGAGLRCLTLSLQLAPPAELWTGERISDIPRLARRVRSMLDRHKSISAWQLALLAALSAAAGSKGGSSSGGLPPAAATAGSKLCDEPEAACKVSHSSGSGPEAQAQSDSHALDQVKAQSSEPCPQTAALELMAHLISLVALVKLAKLAPVERLSVVAGALNAAVACVAPHRAVRQGAAAALLLPSLCKMQLQPYTAQAPTSAVAKAAGAPPLAMCTAPLRQALLKAMSQVHARLDLLLAEAMEAPAAAGWGGDSDGDGSGGHTGGGSTGGGSTGGGQDEGGAASGGGGGSSSGAGDSDSDPNGSFAGADLGELMPTMSAALRVGASAAAVIAECD